MRRAARIAGAAGDQQTQAPAVRLGAQEQQRFDAIMVEIPTLTDTL